MIRSRTLGLFAGLLVSLVVSVPAQAGSQTGTITFSSADQTYGAAGVITLRLTGPSVNKPACATETRWVLNINTDRPINHYLYALALTAMSSGSQVMITGTGTCSVVSTIEDIAYIEVTK